MFAFVLPLAAFSEPIAESQARQAVSGVLPAREALIDKDYYISVPEEYWIHEGVGVKSSDIADGEKRIVVNGFAIEWPYCMSYSRYDTVSHMRRGRAWLSSADKPLVEVFPEYYGVLPLARVGANVVNKTAFDMFRGIADGDMRPLVYGSPMDKLYTVYFSPYGVYTSLWDFFATFKPWIVNDFYNKEYQLYIAALKSLSYGHLINVVTKKEEHVQLHRTEDSKSPMSITRFPMDDEKTAMRRSSFEVKNTLTGFYYDKDMTSIKLGMNLINSTMIKIDNLYTPEAFYSGGDLWCGGLMMYKDAGEFELLRTQFSTLKHSLLFIYPKEAGNYKKVERALDFTTIKTLLREMRPTKTVFRFGWKIFGGEEDQSVSLFNSGYSQWLPTEQLSIAGNEPVNFIHKVWFSTGDTVRRLQYDLSMFFSKISVRYIETLSEADLSDIYEKMLTFAHPFIFFVIDDPTGAILLMGRSSGYKKPANEK